MHAQGAFGDLPMIQNRCLKRSFRVDFLKKNDHLPRQARDKTLGNSKRTIQNSSHLDDEVNTLSKIAKRYGEPLPVEVEPGDCKSKQNGDPPLRWWPLSRLLCHACRAVLSLSLLAVATSLRTNRSYASAFL